MLMFLSETKVCYVIRSSHLTSAGNTSASKKNAIQQDWQEIDRSANTNESLSLLEARGGRSYSTPHVLEAYG